MLTKIVQQKIIFAVVLLSSLVKSEGGEVISPKPEENNDNIKNKDESGSSQDSSNDSVQQSGAEPTTDPTKNSKNNPATAGKSPDSSNDKILIKPRLKHGDEFKFKLDFKNQSTIFIIDVEELCRLLYTESKGQIISLLDAGKVKEISALMRRHDERLRQQKRLSGIVRILGEDPETKSILGQDYADSLNRAKVNKLSMQLTESIELTKTDLDEAEAKLLNEARIGFSGLYVIVNKESQAKDIIRYVEIGLNSRRSSSELFSEAASQYAMVKTLEEGYPATESEISARFGNDVLDVLNETREGSCCKPTKIHRDDRWAIVWLKERSEIKTNESYVYSYALSAKIDSIVSEQTKKMIENGEIKNLATDFSESDLDEKNSRPVLQIGEYSLTNRDVYKFVESVLQNKSLKEMILGYAQEKRKAVVNYFFKAGVELMTPLYVKAILAKQSGLDKDIDRRVEISYKDAYRLLGKYARSLITEQMVREKFEEQKNTIPKTRIVAEYISIESKKVADNIIRMLLNAQENASDDRELTNLFTKMHEDYSVDKNSMFDERAVRMKEFFGQIEPIERNKTKPEDALQINTIYLFRNNKTNLYHIILVKNIDDDKSVTYDEMKRSVLNQMTESKIKALYDYESKSTRVY